jgi:cyclic beta-1,2-glucan synthetase
MPPLSIDPCIPRSRVVFNIVHRYGSSTYQLTVENPLGVSWGVLRASLEGAEVSPCRVRPP